MQKSVHSLKELKAAFQKSAVTAGVELSDAGQHSEAISLFDRVKSLSALDPKSKSLANISYCAHGKALQCKENFIEAQRCFSRAQDACPNDILLLERRRLVKSHRDYRTCENITGFRKCFGLGITSGGYEKYEYPFMEIAKDSRIFEQIQRPVELGELDSLESIGTYRIQAQGRHLLSYKIREYKGKYPYSSANKDLASPFAWLMADFIKSGTKLIQFVDAIIPSPSNPENYVTRGFIPSLLIGQKLSECLAIPYKELFSVSPMSCRFRDMAYSAAKALIRYREKRYDKFVSGHHILLLDDVITSGTTLMLLADLLKSAGARAVYGIALAKTGISR